MPPEIIRVLCLGDVVGSPGRKALQEHIGFIKKDLQIDFTIVNGENACGGNGLDPKHAYELRDCGVDVITLGDHTWDKKELVSLLNENPDWIIRPYNYPAGAPGRGFTTVKSCRGTPVSVVNLLGRVFMNGLWNCPFVSADQILSEISVDCKVTVFDFHCEATSEKIALGRHLDGRASLVFGTHTHVQTADETILPKGTAFICDLGMCGSNSGVIGMDADTAIYRFRTGRPKFYEVAKGEGILNGIVCEIDSLSGKAVRIKRLKCPPQPL